MPAVKDRAAVDREDVPVLQDPVARDAVHTSSLTEVQIVAGKPW